MKPHRAAYAQARGVRAACGCRHRATRHGAMAASVAMVAAPALTCILRQPSALLRRYGAAPLRRHGSAAVATFALAMD